MKLEWKNRCLSSETPLGRYDVVGSGCWRTYFIERGTGKECYIYTGTLPECLAACERDAEEREVKDG